MIPSPVNLSTVPPYRCTTAVAAVDQLGHDLAQPLRTRPPRRCPSNAPRRRTAPSPACTPPIGWQCDRRAALVTELELRRQLACRTTHRTVPPLSVAPRPSPLSSTSVSCHRWSDSVCHIAIALLTGSSNNRSLSGPVPPESLSAPHRPSHRYRVTLNGRPLPGPPIPNAENSAQRVVVRVATANNGRRRRIVREPTSSAMWEGLARTAARPMAVRDV